MEKKIAVVIVGVADMERAVDFYRSKLGLPLKFQTPTYSEFKTQGAVLALEKRDEVHASGPSFTLPTKNAKRDQQTLRRRGAGRPFARETSRVDDATGHPYQSRR